MSTIPEVVVEEHLSNSHEKNGHGENGLAGQQANAVEEGKSSRTGSESSQSGRQEETADEGSRMKSLFCSSAF
jgi:hypothetical protein